MLTVLHKMVSYGKWCLGRDRINTDLENKKKRKGLAMSDRSAVKNPTVHFFIRLPAGRAAAGHMTHSTAAAQRCAAAGWLVAQGAQCSHALWSCADCVSVGREALCGHEKRPPALYHTDSDGWAAVITCPARLIHNFVFIRVSVAACPAYRQ